MKLARRLLTALVLALVLLPQTSQAALPKSGQLITVDQGQTVTDDLYIGGKEVKINGTVNGNVIVAAESTLITGNVTGDVWMIGARLEIKGTVSGSVHFAGAELDITGQVGKDVTAAARDIHISGPVGRDVWVAGNGTILTGATGRDVKVAASQIRLAGPIGGSVQADVGSDLVVASTAIITGNLTYHAQSPITPEPGAQIKGQTSFEQQQRQSKQDSFAENLHSTLYWFAAALILLLAILLYARKAAVATGDVLQKRPGVSFLAGLAFLMLTPLAMIFLALTLIGVPLAIFTIGGYILVIYTAKIFPALLIGTMITKRPATAFWSAAGAGTLGLVIYYVLSSVPILGPIVTFLVICFGSGAQLLLLSQVYQDNRKKYGV